MNYEETQQRLADLVELKAGIEGAAHAVSDNRPELATDFLLETRRGLDDLVNSLSPCQCQSAGG